MLEAVLLKLLVKLTPGWALIRVNFDPLQENGLQSEIQECEMKECYICCLAWNGYSNYSDDVILI